jgi:protein TonB
MSERRGVKAQSYPLSAGHIVLLASLIGLAGCSTVATRESTSELSYAPAAAGSATDQSHLPRPLYTERPEFPWDLRRAGITGMVTVRCTVDERGRVVETKVAGATNDEFIKPALRALRQWQFKPGTRDGVPVTMEILVPIRFSLQD